MQYCDSVPFSSVPKTSLDETFNVKLGKLNLLVTGINALYQRVRSYKFYVDLRRFIACGKSLVLMLLCFFAWMLQSTTKKQLFDLLFLAFSSSDGYS